MYPLLQRQWVAAALPLGELESAGHAAQVPAEVAEVVVRYVPAAQSVHVAGPIESLYFPATQPVHVPPSGPVDPGLQTQLVCATDPSADCVLPGQV